MLAKGLRNALIGKAYRANFPEGVAAYDIEKCLDILMQEGLTLEEAEDFLHGQTIAAYMGEMTPVFIDRRDLHLMAQN